jgi:hypothetical protein
MVGSLARVSHVIGWVMLSRKAVASAEQALRADQQGVRDEIGFLTLHQAFADRFFPGTSVLHTRLRYVLFVPWLMQHSDGDPERFRREALVLTAQLNLGQKQPGVTETGVIGGSIWPSEPSQTPAMAYWSALAHWGILQPRRGLPSLTRTQVLQRLSAIHDSKGQQVEIDGESIWFADIAPFVTLPTPPADFLKPGWPLDFAIAKDERPFLRNQLMAVRRGAPPTDQSLLGRLAEQRVLLGNIDTPWHPAIKKVADADDRRLLDLARQASALAGIGRAAYAALVEQASNRDTGGQERKCRDDLARMRGEHEQVALALDLAQLREAIPSLSANLCLVLDQTQGWLQSKRGNFSSLEDAYQCAEVERKGVRARLGATLGAKRRRAEWGVNTLGDPQLLHYRWRNVRNLLMDLAGS